MMSWLSIYLSVALCLALSPPSRPAEDSTAALIGLWGCERSFGPEVRGELTIVRRGSQWRASVAGFDAPVSIVGGELTFELAGDRGKFRGHLSHDATRIVGHWIQPVAVVWGSRYATPVELKAAGRGVWRGEVEPLEDHLSLYLIFARQADGTIGGFLRNPERNLGAFFRLKEVRREGDVIHLIGRDGTETAARYDATSDRFSIVLPFFNTTFDFTRRGRDNAAGFYPRTPAVDSYTYRRPHVEGDGWATTALSEVGLDPAPLVALVNRILQTKTESGAAPYIHSLLVARHGKLALEEYFYGFDAERAHDMRSASKSLTSALTGIAIDRGAAFDTATPVYTLFPKYRNFSNDDPRKRQMTVENLLTMTGGYDCDENDNNTQGNENNMQSQSAQPDWYKFTLDLPVVRRPGERAVYCSGETNLLGGVISNATKTWLPDFIHDNFARPLAINRYHINLTPMGEAYMGGGIQMRPRDFLKLGQVFLDGGRWHGRQIVSRRWVERSTQPLVSLNRENDYGYTWHLNEYHVGARTYRAYSAEGNGGQLLIVVPDLDLAVMMTAGNYSNFAVWSKFRDELVPQFILTAAR